MSVKILEGFFLGGVVPAYMIAPHGTCTLSFHTPFSGLLHGRCYAALGDVSRVQYLQRLIDVVHRVESEFVRIYVYIECVCEREIIYMCVYVKEIEIKG